MIPRLKDIPVRKEPDKVLLVDPEYFRVIDVKNPYMNNVSVDLELARQQWETLRNIYLDIRSEGVLDEVAVIPGGEDLEDMVFCANQSLPFLDKAGQPSVILSNMRHASRQREVPYFREFYRKRNYRLENLDPAYLFEGMGDAIYHPFRKLIWLGHGYRTSAEIIPHIREKTDMPVVPLRLVSPYFYHLDTCFLPIDEETVAICPEAFDGTGLETIRSVFRNVINVSREVAVSTFCLNTHIIYSENGSQAVAPGGHHPLLNLLPEYGIGVRETDTSEFMKAGGSVFCMKMMFY